MYETFCYRSSVFFFFNDTATTEIYTLSLHDALPISENVDHLDIFASLHFVCSSRGFIDRQIQPHRDRKSTRLNSSHGYISYAVFCLKKKNIKTKVDCAGTKRITGILKHSADQTGARD